MPSARQELAAFARYIKGLKGPSDLEIVIGAAEALADAAEDLLYMEESTPGAHREALRDAWRMWCGAVDTCTDPAINAAQAAYFKDRDKR